MAFTILYSEFKTKVDCGARYEMYSKITKDGKSKWVFVGWGSPDCYVDDVIVTIKAEFAIIGDTRYRLGGIVNTIK